MLEVVVWPTSWYLSREGARGKGSQELEWKPMLCSVVQRVLGMRVLSMHVLGMHVLGMHVLSMQKPYLNNQHKERETAAPGMAASAPLHSLMGRPLARLSLECPVQKGAASPKDAPTSQDRSLRPAGTCPLHPCLDDSGGLESQTD